MIFFNFFTKTLNLIKLWNICSPCHYESYKMNCNFSIISGDMTIHKLPVISYLCETDNIKYIVMHAQFIINVYKSQVIIWVNFGT